MLDAASAWRSELATSKDGSNESDPAHRRRSKPLSRPCAPSDKSYPDTDTRSFLLPAPALARCGNFSSVAVMTTGAESADGWQLLLKDVAARKMGRPGLVISDNTELAAALDRLWPGVARQRCIVHKLRNLLAKAPKHTHEAVREEYHRIVYSETLLAAEKAQEAFVLKWKKQCPGVAASLEGRARTC